MQTDFSDVMARKVADSTAISSNPVAQAVVSAHVGGDEAARQSLVAKWTEGGKDRLDLNGAGGVTPAVQMEMGGDLNEHQRQRGQNPQQQHTGYPRDGKGLHIDTYG